MVQRLKRFTFRDSVFYVSSVKAKIAALQQLCALPKLGHGAAQMQHGALQPHTHSVHKRPVSPHLWVHGLVLQQSHVQLPHTLHLVRLSC